MAVLKPLSSAIAIGTGGPYGAEGPIIVTGGAFGSLFAQAFHLSPVERKTLLVAGAAGGMTAIFATPVTAVLLAIELLLFEFKPRSFIPVACSAAVAGVLRVPLFGPGPRSPSRCTTRFPGRRFSPPSGWASPPGSGRRRSRRSYTAARICSRDCRSIGCGGPRSEGCSWAWAA